MLLKNMRIENVKEEMNKLNDFIVFERERIKEAQDQFNEDCQNFQKYFDSIINSEHDVEIKREALAKEDQELSKKEKDIENEIKEINNEIKKVDEELEKYIQYKDFIESVK